MPLCRYMLRNVMAVTTRHMRPCSCYIRSPCKSTLLCLRRVIHSIQDAVLDAVKVLHLAKAAKKDFLASQVLLRKHCSANGFRLCSPLTKYMLPSYQVCQHIAGMNVRQQSDKKGRLPAQHCTGNLPPKVRSRNFFGSTSRTASPSLTILCTSS